MSDELLPCWRCGAPAKHTFHFNSGYSLNVWHCSKECGAVTLTTHEWQANAKPAHELRKRAEKAEAEVALAYESMGAQVDDWKASALRNKAENERLREALRGIAENSRECQQCSAEHYAVLALYSHKEIPPRKALEGGGE